MLMTREQRQTRIVELEIELAKLRREETEAALTDGEALIDECVKMTIDGRKVEAIRLYRNRMGVSLREALESVENFVRQQQVAV